MTNRLDIKDGQHNMKGKDDFMEATELQTLNHNSQYHIIDLNNICELQFIQNIHPDIYIIYSATSKHIKNRYFERNCLSSIDMMLFLYEPWHDKTN